MTRYILDTHVFLWMDNAPEHLSEKARNILADSKHMLYLSYASIWELQIKISNGKLTTPLPLKQIIEEQVSNGLRLLPIHVRHIYRLESLPRIHQDPFDRLIIAQALERRYPIITVDKTIQKYAVDTIW